MKEKYIEIIKRLNDLKGLLLLDSDGSVYSLKGYTEKDQKVKVGSWPFKKLEQVSYISQIELTTGRKYILDYTQEETLDQIIDSLELSKYRYLRMLSSLNKFNCKVVKK